MLAYVFWHWPRVDDAYEAALLRFHRCLRENPPSGFRGSRVFRIGPRPWVSVPRAYEDWYFVRDFAALGTLNEAAVSGQRKTAHDEIAALPLGGAGGVYRVVSEGPPNLTHASFRSKPSGVTYASYLASLPIGAEVWQRQMVLGPAPEFCLLGTRSLENADPIDVIYAGLT